MRRRFCCRRRRHVFVTPASRFRHCRHTSNDDCGCLRSAFRQRFRNRPLHGQRVEHLRGSDGHPRSVEVHLQQHPENTTMQYWLYKSSQLLRGAIISQSIVPGKHGKHVEVVA